MNDMEELKEYRNALDFWDKAFKNMEANAINETWIENEDFINLLNEGLANANTVLDLGCGSGWGIFEIFNRKKIAYGLGVDTSKNAIEFANKCAKLSSFDNLHFEVGNGDNIGNRKFDFILSVNLLDVVISEVASSLLERIYNCLNENGKVIISLNHNFSEHDFVDVLKMEKKGEYYFKDGVLRARALSDKQWIDIFSEKFIVEKKIDYYLSEGEKKYTRRAFLLRKK